MLIITGKLNLRCQHLSLIKVENTELKKQGHCSSNNAPAGLQCVYE